MSARASSTRWTAGLALAVVCGLGTASAQVQLTVGVWNEKAQPVDSAIVSTFDANGVAFKAINLTGGEYLLINPGAVVANGVKTALVVDGGPCGSASFDLNFVPSLDLRVDVMFNTFGIADVVSTDLQPGPGASAAGAPANDDCAGAVGVAIGSTTAGTTLGATFDSVGDCVTSTTAPGVWYSVVGNGTELTAATCGAFFGYDTKISVFSGDCGSLLCVTGNDDNCATGASGLLSAATWCANAGVTYSILVHGFSTGTGDFDMTVSSGASCAGPPANDTCDGAIAVAVPSVTAGDSSDATNDGLIDCGTSITAPGVWYSVTGTGNTMTASTCTSFFGYDTKLSVFCGDCASPLCVGGNDDDCATGASGLLSTVSWCSEAGATYNIMVHGFSSGVGPFELSVSDNGAPCSGGVACLPPVANGACCFTDGSCASLSAEDCATAGGDYQGDDTECFTAAGSPTEYSASVMTAIPDDSPAGLSHTINVADSGEIADVDVGLSVSHTWTGDLIVTLEHGGTTVTLVDRPGEPALGTFGCDQDNYAGIVLDDEGGSAIEDACAPDLSSPPNYTPNEALSAFDGMDSSGDWTLTISDNAAQDTGSFDSWSVIIDSGDAICEEPECFLVVGGHTGSCSYTGVEHEFTTQVGPLIEDSYAVLMDSIPEFVLPPNFARGETGAAGSSGSMAGGPMQGQGGAPSWMMDRHFAVQILMWNPMVFPGQPEQYTLGLDVTISPTGRVSSVPYGDALGGVTMWHELDVNDQGQPVIRFPFNVPMN